MNPDAAATPCRNRNPIRTSTVSASAQPSAATAVSSSPPTMTGFLPNRSDNGPGKSCPTATPTMNRLRLSCTSVRVEPSPSTMAGIAGSVPSIPMAVAIEVSASKAANPKLPGGFKGWISGPARERRATPSLTPVPRTRTVVAERFPGRLGAPGR